MRAFERAAGKRAALARGARRHEGGDYNLSAIFFPHQLPDGSFTKVQCQLGKGTKQPCRYEAEWIVTSGYFQSFFFFQTTHMVGVWPLPLIYTDLLKQFCSFWRYFNLPSCHSYLVRKRWEQKKTALFYFVLLSCVLCHFGSVSSSLDPLPLSIPANRRVSKQTFCRDSPGKSW